MALGIKLFKGQDVEFEELQIRIDEFFISQTHIKVISIHQSQSSNPVTGKVDIVISVHYEF